ncbi:SixA phosphatase family protein [Roseixanthobacter glucoisosaccharinicivorans]|uniref:SixA phosphatase family protein n=1 Tax=Roseixanthobacter glucoisosaccharinicivorans TaxID=3119923 RepID=UPI00372B1C47
MRRLILLRHAKSDWPEGIVDAERPLAQRGRAAAPVIGSYMAAQDLVPDRVLISPARRTRETWQLVAPALPASLSVASEPRLYDASVSRILSVLREQPREIHRLMLVGHNPGLEEIADVLTDQGPAATRALMAEKFPTGALAIIDLPIDDWADVMPQTGRLDRFVTPRSLMLEM